MHRRPKEQIRKIDAYLRAHYNEDGPKSCAQALNEDEVYIRSRAWYLKVPADRPKRAKPEKTAPVRKRETKREKELLSRLYELRKGLMLVTADNHRLQEENKELKEKLDARSSARDAV
jgi:hypothetical protein